ncbi:hypothetical protein [Luteibacter sp. ME-Dv--P-043b]|uniref:hypothetical protein n=1 Tax=Luteibacter sp. ME-Dv--P-043b TaxID=3040291 RepID=UPI002556334D|nr:hypothetical protein [Luteibacter sp. ME-Dv--P-043b]
MISNSLKLAPLIAFSCAVAACQVSNTGYQDASSSNAASVFTPLDTAKDTGPDAGSECKLDLFSGHQAAAEMVAKHGIGAAFEGWAFIKGQPALHAATLAFRGDAGSFGVPLRVGIARPDVASAFGDENLSNAGFAVTADISKLPAGVYAAEIRTDVPDNLVVCDLHARIRVVN